MNGAANAFELIIKAYNQGKSNILLTLLDGELYNAFVQEIQNRKNLGNVHEDVIVSILSQKIVNVSLINNTAYIVVKFITEQINLIKDINGNLVSGNVSKINKVEDKWQFKQDITSLSQKWYLTSVNFIS